jgi:HAD superfamily hydrolase (TIGR01509 family)
VYPPLRRNWLFDCDGTLLDTGSLHELAFRQALQEHLPERQAHFCYDAVKGRATREVFAELGVEEPLLEILTTAKQRIYRELAVQGRVNLFSGAQQLLDILSCLGSALFIVTSGSDASIRSVLQATRIERMFCGVITANDVARAKPAPELYLCCLQRFGLHACDCVVVEDAMSGVLAARSAGLAVIGVHNASIAGVVDEFFPCLSQLTSRISALRMSEAAVS